MAKIEVSIKYIYFLNYSLSAISKIILKKIIFQFGNLLEAVEPCSLVIAVLF